MAGPRFLGINNIQNPYESAQRAVQDAGSIYMLFNEDARRAEDAARVKEEANRLRQERETLATYTPKIGENFFGIDADTQNLIRQNEEQVLRQNDEALARKDPKAVAREELEKSFLTARSRLADRNTVLSSVVNDLVAQGVSPQNAELRATQIASQYGSVGDLAAAEQARVDSLNEAEADRLQNVLSLYKTDSSNRRALVSGFTDSKSSRTGTTKTTGKNYAPGQPLTPQDVSEAVEGVAALTGNAGMLGIGRGDADKAVQSALSAYSATNSDIERSNNAIRQRAIAAGRDPNREQYEPLLKWDDVLGRVTETLQLDRIDARGAFNEVGTARAGITEPLRRRSQADQIRGANTSASSGGRTDGISFDAASRILAGSPELVAAVVGRPAVARSLTDINKERVASVYSQYLRSAPATEAARAPSGSAQRQVPPPAQRTPAPERRILGTLPVDQPTDQEVRVPNTTSYLTPPAPVASGAQRGATPLARPNLQGLAPEVANVVQSATNELTNLYARRETLPENRRQALEQRIKETEDGLREVGVYDRVAAVVDANVPTLLAEQEEAQALKNRLNTFEQLRNQANASPPLLNRNSPQFATDRALSQVRLARFVEQNPDIVELYNRRAKRSDLFDRSGRPLFLRY